MEQEERNKSAPVFVQIDLDGLWAIRQCYGYPEGDAFCDDPVYTEGLTRIFDLLQRYNLTSTLFIVGKDLEVPEKVEILRRFRDAGHECAAHSYSHPIGMGELAPARAEQEIKDATSAIRDSLDTDVNGFRVPGYDVTTEIWELLARSGYRYDASLFQSPWTVMLKGFVRLFIKKGQGATRQFGHGTSGAFPRTPFRIGDIKEFEESPCKDLMEFPVMASPRLRLPVQVSYAQLLGAGHFIHAAEYHRRHTIPVTCILHGIDLVDTQKIAVLPDAPFYSRMFFNIPMKRKMRVVTAILEYIAARYRPYTLSEWLER